MGGKVDVASGADDPRRQGKEDKAKQDNLAHAHASAAAVGNQDSDTTPAPAKGSGPNTDKSGSVKQNKPSAGRTSDKGDH